MCKICVKMIQKKLSRVKNNQSTYNFMYRVYCHGTRHFGIK